MHFQMLADYMVTIEGLEVVCTKMTDVVSNTVEDLSSMKSCNHEEADTRYRYLQQPVEEDNYCNC